LLEQLAAYNLNLSTGITVQNGTLKILHDIEMLSSSGGRKTISSVKADENSDQLSLISYEYWINHKSELQGPTGAQGPIGPSGIQGPQGPQGIKGDNGEDGDSTSWLDWFSLALDAGEIAGMVALQVEVHTLQGVTGGLTSWCTAQDLRIAALETQASRMWGEDALDNMEGLDNIDDITQMPLGGDGFFSKMFNSMKDWFSEIGNGMGNANVYQPLYEDPGLINI
jgi:hypothetical protein